MLRGNGTLGSKDCWLQHCVRAIRRIAGAAPPSAIAICLLAPVSSRAQAPGGEQAAEALLDEARKNRETLSKEFPGFRSKLIVHKDGEVHEGRMHFKPPITLEVEFEDADVRKRVKSTVRSLLSHRMASNESSGSKKETITFAEKDRHPLGRRIFLGDTYGSSYRIRDNRILEVDRNMDDSRLLITVMETQVTPSGKYLPTHVFVAVFDKATGSVQHSVALADVYQEVGGDFLPRSRKVVRAADGRTETLLIEWEEMQLLSLVSTD